jgi:hypothetical protein
VSSNDEWEIIWSIRRSKCCIFHHVCKVLRCAVCLLPFVPFYNWWTLVHSELPLSWSAWSGNCYWPFLTYPATISQSSGFTCRFRCSIRSNAILHFLPQSNNLGHNNRQSISKSISKNNSIKVAKRISMACGLSLTSGGRGAFKYLYMALHRYDFTPPTCWGCFYSKGDRPCVIVSLSSHACRKHFSFEKL